MDRLQKVTPSHNDAVIKQAIVDAVMDSNAYGNRCVLTRLRLKGQDKVNHDWVYRAMRDEGWLLYRPGEKTIIDAKRLMKGRHACLVITKIRGDLNKLLLFLKCLQSTKALNAMPSESS